MMLKIGTSIMIDKDFPEDGEKYKSRVIDSGENFVMIDYPTHIETGKTAFFMDGTQLFISFTDDLKISYTFKTEISGRLNKGVPMLRLVYPGNDQLVKIQRREFVRVETALDVAIKKDGLITQLVADDVSAGGMALNLPNPELFHEKEIIELMIVLPFINAETTYVQVKGEIVRIFEKSKRMIASIHFVDIREDDRQRIVRYCFELQLQMRNG